MPERCDGNPFNKNIMKLTEDQAFEQIDFQVQPFTIGEYENCSFIKCIFIGIDLGGSIFINCTFTDCDMSVVKVNQVVLMTRILLGANSLVFYLILAKSMDWVFLLTIVSLIMHLFTEPKLKACVL